MDKDLDEFLRKWELVRVAQIAKWKNEAEYWEKREPQLRFTARRKVEYYEHELKMLRELRARAL